jgi:DnaJ family protein C protein 28
MAKIDDHIRKAIEEGKFDNLPGKGQPLRWEQDANEDPDWRLAYHLLRSNGFSLPWIETRREIEESLAATHQALARAWKWRAQALASLQPAALVEQEWQRALRAFRSQIAEVNQRIFNYNLEVPASRFQMRSLDVEREIAEICRQS